MAAQKVWRGHLQLGMLNIPVFLNVAARDKKVEMHNHHTECNSPVKMPKYCPACQVILQPTEIFRGYDTGSGVVKLTDAELEAITPETDRIMRISDCVLWSEIEPEYLAESYYMLPDDAGKKAYSLLNRVLTETGRVAIAQLTKSSREHVVIIRPKDNGLMLHFIWFANEIARVPEFDELQEEKVSANEMKLAKQLVESKAAVFVHDEYENGYLQRLNTLIASKLDSKIQPPVPVKSTTIAVSQDIAAVLEASLAQATPKRAIKLSGKKKSKKVA